MKSLLFLYDPLKGINQAFYFFENLQIFQKNQKFQKLPKSPNLAIFAIKKNYEIKKILRNCRSAQRGHSPSPSDHHLNATLTAKGLSQRNGVVACTSIR